MYVYNIYVLYIAYPQRVHAVSAATAAAAAEMKRYIERGIRATEKIKREKNGNWCFFFVDTNILYCVRLRRKIAGFYFPDKCIYYIYYFEKYLHMRSGYKKIGIRISDIHTCIHTYVHTHACDIFMIYVQKYI